MSKPLTLRQFQDRFPTEASCLDHLFQVRYGTAFDCPKCGRPAKYTRVTKRRSYQCQWCAHQVYPTAGTPFDRTRTSLRDWFYVMFLFTTTRNGVAAKRVEREIGVTYKTAWFLCHRIREAMDGADDGGPLGGPGKIVEADEMFVGGKSRNRAFRDPAPKKPVVSLVERDGRARSFHVANINAATLRTVMVTNIDRASFLMTDDANRLRPAGYEFKLHATVNHSKREYTSDREISRLWTSSKGKWHTNTAENFFSIFKRGVIGVYHHMSEAHLHRYCREFDMRYNTRTMTDGERAALILKGGIGRRLTYRRTDALAA